MRLVSFESDGRRIGAVIGDMILDVTAARPLAAASVDELVRRGLVPEAQNLVDNAAEIDRRHFRPIKGTRLCPPIQNPSKVICLGLNYRGHAVEQKKEPPDHPLLFAKAPSALAGPLDDIVIRPGVQSVDGEAELAVVIGREGTMIPREEALNYVAGYMAMNDVSAREAQRADKQWFRGKSFDTFAPCGPWLVTPNDVGDPQSLAIRQKWNDVVMQEGNTADMIFDVAAIISFVSSAMTLCPGDIISTGTPGGVGLYRTPPVFLKDGDVVTVEIERIGFLRNKVRILK